MAALRPKQQRFVEEYLVDLNASQAALRAGYSRKSAPRLGLELLSKTHVAAAIRAANAARSQRTAVTADRVVRELAALAFSDLRELATWGPEGVSVTPAETLREQAARAVQEVVSTTKTTTRRGEEGTAVTTVEVQTRLKLYNKVHALVALGKHLDVFREPTADELANEEFLRALLAVVLKHVTEHAARKEIEMVIASYAGSPRVRNITPSGAR